MIFNQTWEGDDELEKWIRNRDFRIALSHAINRDTINEVVFLGIGRPHMGYQPLSPHSPGDAVGEQYQSYGEFDPAKASQMLDAMGLTAKDGDGFRVRTDNGGRLVFPLSFTQVFADSASVAEIVVENLRAVGIAAEADSLERDLYETRRDANELAIHFGSALDAGPNQFGTGANNAGTFGAWLPGPAWAANYEDPSRGVTPTDPDILRLRELWDLGKDLPLAGRIPYGKEILKINMENVWAIGFVGFVPCGRCILVKKNYFKNVPLVTSLDGNWPGEARPEQFYIDR
jgi:peptide/nickel transport system substrate-binding protein